MPIRFSRAVRPGRRPRCPSCCTQPLPPSAEIRHQSGRHSPRLAITPASARASTAASGSGCGAQLGHIRLHDHRAHARQQRIVDPAALTVLILDPPPVLEFGRDLQRHVAVAEHPVDPVRQRRAAPRIALGRLQRHEARQRQVRDLADALHGLDSRRRGLRRDAGRTPARPALPQVPQPGLTATSSDVSALVHCLRLRFGACGLPGFAATLPPNPEREKSGRSLRCHRSG